MLSHIVIRVIRLTQFDHVCHLHIFCDPFRNICVFFSLKRQFTTYWFQQTWGSIHVDKLRQMSYVMVMYLPTHTQCMLITCMHMHVGHELSVSQWVNLLATQYSC